MSSTPQGRALALPLLRARTTQSPVTVAEKVAASGQSDEEAIVRLQARDSNTLNLFYFQGLALREIGERLNEPLGNVRHHFYRGLEKLRKSAFVRKLREKQAL